MLGYLESLVSQKGVTDKLVHNYLVRTYVSLADAAEPTGRLVRFLESGALGDGGKQNL